MFDPSNDGSGRCFEVLDSVARDKLLYMLLMTPNGVVDMSAEIDGLVETSLNLGILMTEADKIVLHYTLRSNKESALLFLEDRLAAFASYTGCRFEISGRYAPWEFKKDSPLQKLYRDAFCEKFGRLPKLRPFMPGWNARCSPRKLKIWIVLR